jgi:hypothetical protein
MPGGIPIPPSPILAPIGSVVAWLKSYTNTPALPSGWVECNGQTLSDAESVYNGQTIPNLNGNNYFLRGDSTSGSTGGASTHTHSVSGTSGTPAGTLAVNGAGGTVVAASGHTHSISITSGSGSSLPPNYTVVWIMRVK